MSYLSIRLALAERLKAIPGVVNVHPYTRYDSQGFNNASFKALFVNKETRDVHAWWFGSPTFAQAPCDDDDSTEQRQHQIEIRGLRGLVDAEQTENLIRDLAEVIADELTSGDRTLGGACETHSSPQLTRTGHIMFYDKVLAHEAVLSLTVWENVSHGTP